MPLTERLHMDYTKLSSTLMPTLKSPLFHMIDANSRCQLQFSLAREQTFALEQVYQLLNAADLKT